MGRHARGVVIEIPQNILSDAFKDRIGERRLRAAVFLTFRFEPGFFEQDVLPVFLDVSLSHVPALRLLNLEEELRKVDAIAVYYDRRALVPGVAPGQLDVQRVALSHRTGFFHPKNVLALVEDDAGATSLIVAAMSANLTRAGWWENVEVAHIEELTEDEPSPIRNDVRALIRRVRDASPPLGPDQKHHALDAIEVFLARVHQDDQRLRDGTLQPRLFVRGSVVDFLTSELNLANRVKGCNLEVLSPYFDEGASAGPLEDLIDSFRFKPTQVRLFLPRGLDNEALCSSEYFTRISEIAAWGTLPDSVMKLSRTAYRTLHAKLYRFWKRDYEAFFIGSVNLTNAAFNRSGRGGNFESGFFVENPSPPRHLSWWLTPLTEAPNAFAKRTEADTLQPGIGYKLSLQYDWGTGTTSGYWDADAESPALTLLSNGVAIGRLAPLPPRIWKFLDAAVSDELTKILRSTSFLTVRVEGENDAEILIDELHMTHKPSLVRSLSTDDILRYWALLTPEQKQEFLEEHASEMIDDPELALWLTDRRKPQEADSFFTTFAQIYLSFGNVERTVLEALRAGRNREAVDRLFGKRFDSVRRLVDRISEEDAGDPVRHYITLLCAEQLLDALEEIEDSAEFMKGEARDVRSLRDAIAASSNVRERLSTGNAEEDLAFFPWFDRWFLKRAKPVEVDR